jgi:hypothetical protein
MEAKVKNATKRDVELRQADIELAKIHAAAERNRMVGQGVRGALIVMSFAIPIWAMQGLVEPLAGKTTIVKASIVVSISLTASIGGNFFQWLKGRERRHTIGRLRTRITDLERRLQGGSS